MLVYRRSVVPFSSTSPAPDVSTLLKTVGIRQSLVGKSPGQNYAQSAGQKKEIVNRGKRYCLQGSAERKIEVCVGGSKPLLDQFPLAILFLAARYKQYVHSNI